MMTRNLAALFDVKPGEGKRTLLLWLLSFCGGLAHVFAYSASRALFLTWRVLQTGPQIGGEIQTNR